MLARLRDGARTQDRLREAEAKYRTLVEQLPLVTYIDALTTSATSLYVSPQLLHPDDRERILISSTTATTAPHAFAPSTA